jgi:hypothetical protein
LAHHHGQGTGSYAARIERIEKQYGIDPYLMLGLWGMESVFGEMVSQGRGAPTPGIGCSRKTSEAKIVAAMALPTALPPSQALRVHRACWSAESRLEYWHWNLRHNFKPALTLSADNMNNHS